MSKFVLNLFGDTEVPKKLSKRLDLVQVEPISKKSWVKPIKTFEAIPPKSRGRKLAGYGLPHALPMRPFDNGGVGDRAKAIAYARWLLKRDKRRVPEKAIAGVEFGEVKMQGYKRPVKQAFRVTFKWRVGKFYPCECVVEIPHHGYDPTKPPTDESECVLQGLPL